MKLKETVLALYLAMAPIYWVPALSVGVVSAFKICVFFLMVALIWIPTFQKYRASIPRGIWGIGGLGIFLALSMFGLFQSELNDIRRHFQELTIGFIALWTGFVFSKTGANIERISAMSLTFFSPAAILTLLAGVTGWPNWTNPFLQEPFTLANTGLGGVRTGWSVAIALLLAFGLSTDPRRNRYWPKTIKPYIFPIFILLLVGNQVVVGGRSGILASIILIFFVLGVKNYRNHLWVLTILVALIWAIDYEWIFYHLRLDRLGASNNLDFSAGRIELNNAALKVIRENILFGIGVGEVPNSLIDMSGDIHNLWLRLAVEYGVLLPLAFFGANLALAFQTTLLFINARPNSVIYHNAKTILGLLLTGLTVSMFEPKVLIGTFQTSAAWWIGIGLCLGNIGTALKLELAKAP